MNLSINIGVPITNFLSKEILKSTFKNKKYNLIFNNSKKKLNENQLIRKFRSCHFLISGTEKYNHNVLKSLKNLKAIIRVGVGIDNIDLNSAKLKKIKIYKTSNKLNSSVAELALTHIMILSRNLYDKERNHQYEWHRQYGNLIEDKKIGILGYGNIGKKFHSLIKAFNPNKIYVHDKFLNISEYNIDKDTHNIKSLKLFFKLSDIISIHLPLNKDTINLINKHLLNHAKKSLILINTSRAEIINEKDIFNHMKNNISFKLGLDVFWNEPEIGKIKNLKNVSLSSHIGSYTLESRMSMEDKSIKILKRLTK